MALPTEPTEDSDPSLESQGSEGSENVKYVNYGFDKHSVFYDETKSEEYGNVGGPQSEDHQVL